jgi:hypothetical protein
MGRGLNTQHGANLGTRAVEKPFADDRFMLQCSMPEESPLFDQPCCFLLPALNQYQAILKNY